MFLLVCGILFTGRSASVHAGIPPPPGPDTPLGPDTPKDQAHPPEGSTPPRTRHPPGKEAPPPGIRSMSSRYASYWNAFLLQGITIYFFNWKKTSCIFFSTLLAKVWFVFLEMLWGEGLLSYVYEAIPLHKIMGLQWWGLWTISSNHNVPVTLKLPL